MKSPLSLKQYDASDWLLAAGISLTIVLSALFGRANHWMLIPLFVSGVLIMVDAVAWLRGKVDVYDPIGIVGMVGTNFFFLAPLLHVAFDSWRRFHEPIDTKWVAGITLINCVGLIFYRTVLFSQARQVIPSRVVHLPNWKNVQNVFLIALGITFAVQLGTYFFFGGLDGYIDAYENRKATGEMVGMAWIFMIGESFPILLMLWWALSVQRRGQVPSWVYIFAMLIFYFVLQLFFGGMRGSRGNTIYHLFWVVGAIHFAVRPFSRSQILAGVLFCCVFMVVYGAFKSGGREGLEDYVTGGYVDDFTGESGRAPLLQLLLGDMSRTDPQARVLEGLLGDRRYEPAMGASYVGTAALLIPRQIWPDRPKRKGFYGSQAMYGKFSEKKSSTPYGVSGEAMLNFGIIGAVLSFVFYGWVISQTRAYIAGIPRGDIRWLLVPLYINLCITFLVGDSDNTLFYFIKNGLVPIAVIYLVTIKVNRTDFMSKPMLVSMKR